MRFEGSTYIAFFVKMFQIERKEVEFYVSDPFTSDTTLVFDNLLVGVEVFRKKAKQASSKFIFSIMILLQLQVF